MAVSVALMHSEFVAVLTVIYGMKLFNCDEQDVGCNKLPGMNTARFFRMANVILKPYLRRKKKSPSSH